MKGDVDGGCTRRLNGVEVMEPVSSMSRAELMAHNRYRKARCRWPVALGGDRYPQCLHTPTLTSPPPAAGFVGSRAQLEKYRSGDFSRGQ